MALKHALARPAKALERARSVDELLEAFRSFESRVYAWEYDYSTEDCLSAFAAIRVKAEARLKSFLTDPAQEHGVLLGCASRVLPAVPAGLPEGVTELLEAKRRESLEVLANAPGWVLVHRKGTALAAERDFSPWRLACARWGLDEYTACLPTGAAALLGAGQAYKTLGYGPDALKIFLDELPSASVLEVTAALAKEGLGITDAYEAAQAL
jgi:hypothetical protein